MRSEPNEPNGCALGVVVFVALIVSVMLAAWCWVVREERRYLL